MTTNIREWYSREYPEDRQKDQIDAEVTFERVAAAGIEIGSSDLAYMVGEWLDQHVIDRIGWEYASRIRSGELEFGKEYGGEVDA